jgi:uncharacterized membrane protein
MLAIARSVHLLAAVVWVGGMFFAWFALRPAASELEASTRVRLWSEVLRRFFAWVWVSVVAVVLSGYWLLFAMGGFGAAGVHIHIMHLLGLVMTAVFLHVYFAPFRRLQRAVDAANVPWAGEQLHQIRILVALNLSLGVLTVLVASGLRYLV